MCALSSCILLSYRQMMIIVLRLGNWQIETTKTSMITFPKFSIQFFLLLKIESFSIISLQLFVIKLGDHIAKCRECYRIGGRPHFSITSVNSYHSHFQCHQSLELRINQCHVKAGRLRSTQNRLRMCCNV